MEQGDECQLQPRDQQRWGSSFFLFTDLCLVSFPENDKSQNPGESLPKWGELCPSLGTILSQGSQLTQVHGPFPGEADIQYLLDEGGTKPSTFFNVEQLEWPSQIQSSL